MHHRLPGLGVATADEARALDARCIAGGTPGAALMQRAGAAAAGEITRRHAAELHRGVLVLAGPGNNGGDGWVIARALHAASVPVQVWSPADPGDARSRDGDAAHERRLALDDGVAACTAFDASGAGIVVDALLGTGATGAPREAMAAAVRWTNGARGRGTVVVAIDVPTGVDATTGDVADRETAIHADLTLTFGTYKRGHLVAREQCGRVVVLDIGLARRSGEGGRESGAATLPVLLDAAAAHALLPSIAADAHKGTKGRVAIVGGAEGMAGAVILAARGALRAGAGLVKVVAHPTSLDAVRAAVPQALTAAWDGTTVAEEVATWADALAIGPGLGNSIAGRDLVERMLATGSVPAVLDADALNVFAGEPRAIRAAIGARQVLLTPHPLEMARLCGTDDVGSIVAARFDVGTALAQASGATVLLKGIPTTISSPDGRRYVTATGNTALATGGSGDILAGMAATLLAQCGDPLRAGAVAAWAHGRAAEIATDRAATSRGISLDEIADVVAELAHLPWSEGGRRHAYPVLGELP